MEGFGTNESEKAYICDLEQGNLALQEDCNKLQAKLDKPITEHPDVQRLVKQVVELEAKLKAIKEQYAKDLVAEDTHFFPNPICKNQPPEITNGCNACLSCPMRNTCLLIFRGNKKAEVKP